MAIAIITLRPSSVTIESRVKWLPIQNNYVDKQAEALYNFSN